MNESPIKDEIVSLIFGKGEDLTDSDVRKTEKLLDELEMSNDLDDEEVDELREFVARVIGQVSVEPNSKLSPNGST
jgi:hypothetical protein